MDSSINRKVLIHNKKTKAQTNWPTENEMKKTSKRVMGSVYKSIINKLTTGKTNEPV